MDNDTIHAATDNGTATSADCGAGRTADDTSAITLTDGTMTIILGEASHLSGQNVSTSSTASGSISMDANDEDLGAGAFVGAFHGVSLGYKISDTMSATVAYQLSGDNDDMMGAGDYIDGENPDDDDSDTHTTSGFGVAFSGTFGPATVGITQASASTADQTGATAPGLLSTTSSTMGLGVKIDLGDIDPFISYGTYTADGSATKAQHTHTASEFGLTYALGTDTVILYVGNSEDRYGELVDIESLQFATDTAKNLATLGEFTIPIHGTKNRDAVSEPLSRAGPLPAIVFSLPIKMVGFDNSAIFIVAFQCFLLFQNPTEFCPIERKHL